MKKSLTYFIICAVLYALAYVSKLVFPIMPKNILTFVGCVQKFFFMAALVVAVCAALSSFIKKVCSKTKRGRTMTTVLQSLIRYAEVIIIGLWGLSIFGVNTTAIFASLGIVGLVIGFGAQSLIEDIITGMFILFEGIYDVGDVIELDNFRGAVKKIGIRTTAILDLGGNVKIVNNSDIRNVLNRSKNNSTSICDIGISYDESLEKAENVLKDALVKIKNKYADMIIDGPTYVGVQNLADSAVVLRIIAKVNEKNVYDVNRILNREIKIAFDENEINIPYPQIVVHQNK